MPFVYDRHVRFQDTDAAGVVYFANVLAICHEAYEASLAASGMNLREFFSPVATVFPVTHAEVDFLRPLFCGDRLSIHLIPRQISPQEFEIQYQIFRETAPEKPASQALTRHICIDATNRKRQEIPQEIIYWLEKWKSGNRELERGNG